LSKKKTERKAQLPLENPERRRERKAIRACEVGATRAGFEARSEGGKLKGPPVLGNIKGKRALKEGGTGFDQYMRSQVDLVPHQTRVIAVKVQKKKTRRKTDKGGLS